MNIQDGNQYETGTFATTETLMTRKEGTLEDSVVLNKDKPKKKARYLIIGILSLVLSPVYAFVLAAGIASLSEVDWNQILPEARSWVVTAYIIEISLIGFAILFLLLSGIMLIRRRNSGRYWAGLVMASVLLDAVFSTIFQFVTTLHFPASSVVGNITYTHQSDYTLTYLLLGVAIFPVIACLVVRKRI